MKKVLVTGSDGLLGTAIKQVAGESSDEFHFSNRAEADLSQPQAAVSLINLVKPDAIIHAAAVVGGIRLNMESPELLMEQNRTINRNILNAAFDARIPKVISFLSTCIFPVDAEEPWDESIIHMGEPDNRQWGYAQAKREMDLLNRKFTALSAGKAHFVSLTPSTMYGPNDNYNAENSHVLPAVVRKIFEANSSGTKPVFWGSGTPRREFIYTMDVARIVLWAIENYKDAETLILSNGGDHSVKEIVEATAEVLGYQGDIEWDTSKPDGRLTRTTDPSNTSNPRRHF